MPYGKPKGFCILLLFLSFLVGCDQQKISEISESYSIDAQHILTKLSAEDPALGDLFIREQGSHSASPTFGRTEAYWNDDEFQLVARALLEHTWQEPPDEWRLYNKLYVFDCEKPINGAVSADFLFFRETPEGFDDIWMGIRLFGNIVHISKRSTYTMPITSETINWNEYISAMDALEIADKFGGESVRLQAETGYCYITVSFDNSDTDQPAPIWQVHYSDDIDVSETYWVNARTGELSSEVQR